MSDTDYDRRFGTLSRPIMERAMRRLGDLLKEKRKSVELVAAGGVISRHAVRQPADDA